VLEDTALDLNKLNMLDDESTNVTVMLAPDPASSDTKIDFTTVVVAVGTVYNVVRSVVVKSTFLFLKLLAINLKRSFVHQLHPLVLVDMLYLIFARLHQDLLLVHQPHLVCM
jgi:hypothetical protein